MQLNSLRCQADSRACHQRNSPDRDRQKKEEAFVPRILIIQIGLPSEFNRMHLPVKFNYATTIKKIVSLFLIITGLNLILRMDHSMWHQELHPEATFSYWLSICEALLLSTKKSC